MQGDPESEEGAKKHEKFGISSVNMYYAYVQIWYPLPKYFFFDMTISHKVE